MRLALLLYATAPGGDPYPHASTYSHRDAKEWPNTETSPNADPVNRTIIVALALLCSAKGAL